jgi:hypothetical protein
MSRFRCEGEVLAQCQGPSASALQGKSGGVPSKVRLGRPGDEAPRDPHGTDGSRGNVHRV